MEIFWTITNALVTITGNIVIWLLYLSLTLVALIKIWTWLSISIYVCVVCTHHEIKSGGKNIFIKKAYKEKWGRLWPMAFMWHSVFSDNASTWDGTEFTVANKIRFNTRGLVPTHKILVDEETPCE